MDDMEWKANFTLSKKSFDYIVLQVTPYLKNQNTSMRQSIPVDKRVAVAIYALSSSAEFRTVSNLFGVGNCTVCNILREFCSCVNETLITKFIHFSATTIQIKTLIENFDNYWGFPQCIGAIDGCHIPLSPPKLHAVDYYNYKGWYSTVLLAACDYKYRFIYINVGAPGRNNDSHLYKSSQLRKLLS